MAQEEMISIYGARVHNLKDIQVDIPRQKLVIITGVSGSGKSSLAFDTLYAEGQRRYMESFSAYARQFIGQMERPDVDKITGLSPVISIEQKVASKNPRSTVGTVTEIYDFLRLLFARAGEAFSYKTGEKMVRYTEDQILDRIMKDYGQKKIILLAPLVQGRKGHYRELFDQIHKQGYLKARIDGEILEIDPGMKLDRYKIHDIELIIDRINVTDDKRDRLRESLQTCLQLGKDLIMIIDHESGDVAYYSKQLMCPTTGISYAEPSPNNFSFNSPYGACTYCKGLGVVKEIQDTAIIPDKSKSIHEGGIAPVGKFRNNYIFKQLRSIAKRYKFSLSDPIREIPEEALAVILYGTDTEKLEVALDFDIPDRIYSIDFEGVIPRVNRHYHETSSDSIRRWAEDFMEEKDCPECKGQRLKQESLHFLIDEKNIAEVASLDLNDLKKWLEEVPGRLTDKQKQIGKEVIKEVKKRVGFLLNVGLQYLNLNRQARTLSGGESQRIRLATQIGSQLTGITYILDEPSIGLHQRDNHRLIDSLKTLVDMENSVIVVEHDKDIMLRSDHVIDLGPGAGKKGGELMAYGTPDEFKNKKGLTAAYLREEEKIKVPAERRKGNGKKLILTGASGHNLKNVTATFPLGTFICITGVSGSGKSSMINETLYPVLNRYFFNAKKKPLPHEKVEGLNHLDKVIEIDQSPIGRTPRSNPATYTNVFTDIRELFSSLPEAQIRGYKPGRFSFNVKGGRCEVCGGAGVKVIEMNFLPDVHVECEKCMGKRYNRETLEVRYKGKSISDVLQMPVDEAVEFFENIPNIYRKLKIMHDVGLGYLTLGQPSTTLSGGEAQRVKLSEELSKKDTGNTFYILDEPTTGLHFEDIKMLLNVLNKLVDKGNTVVVTEHNLDVIKVSDHIIDLGPEGGAQGGKIIATGPPEAIAANTSSYTGQFLKEEL